MDEASHSPIIALHRLPDMLLGSFYDTIVNFLHLLLIADRATAKEIDIARAYFAKDSGTYDNSGSYRNVGIGICMLN